MPCTFGEFLALNVGTTSAYLDGRNMGLKSGKYGRKRPSALAPPWLPFHWKLGQGQLSTSLRESRSARGR